jgi:hypothetical protein
VILRDRHGEALQRRGGRIQHSEVQRLIEAGAPLIELNVDRPHWVADPVGWWRENAEQVETSDHPAAGPWPTHAAYVASVWFSSAGRVLVFDVHC